MEFKKPEFHADAFNCPICCAYAHMEWSGLVNQATEKFAMYVESTCSCCQKSSLWHVISVADHPDDNHTGVLIYPDSGTTASPEADMPDDVKRDYFEAASIFSKSPRASAALLRLGLQKLCQHLGEEGKNINKDIRSLAAQNKIPPLVVKVADTVRITGNNAVHPGEMSEEDVDHVASKMFDLINFIVKKCITEPQELEALYQLTPESPRAAAEARDARSISAKGSG